MELPALTEAMTPSLLSQIEARRWAVVDTRHRAPHRYVLVGEAPHRRPRLLAPLARPPSGRWTCARSPTLPPHPGLRKWRPAHRAAHTMLAEALRARPTTRPTTPGALPPVHTPSGRLHR